MFKSIFSKYITATTLIVVASFVVLATVLTAVIGGYGKSTRKEEVEHLSDLAAEIVSHGCSDMTPPISLGSVLSEKEELLFAITSLCTEEDNAWLFIIDSQDKLIFASDSFSDEAGKLVEDGGYWGEVISAVSSGTPYSAERKLAALGNEEYLIYVTPLLDGEGRYLGCAYVAASVGSVKQITIATTQTVIMACLWVMLAILIAVYFITERHVDPIRRMSRAAHGYAKGDFSERVEPVGGDEIAELAGALNYMASELEGLEQKRNRFISDVSHELRSPMTSMLGFVEAVADGSCPPEKQSYYLSLVAEEIKRLSRLVADLLDVSRLEMGERKMNFAPYDLCDTAATVLISLEKRINDKGLDVSFEAEEDKLFISADADAMYRAVYNLIENAVKFSREGGRLAVSLSATEKAVRLSVYNEGIGISAEDLPNIFERFYKSDKSRGEDKKGVGLGLYFVKTILLAHGGNIRAESTEGEYCLFEAELPRYRQSE